MKNFSLTKAEVERRDGYATKLNEAWDTLNAAVSTFNDSMLDLQDPVQRAMDDYNEVRAEAEAFAADIANEIETGYDEKSDNWREGERGQAVDGMKDEWQGIDLGEVEITFPDSIDLDDPGHAASLEALPVEPD